MKSLLPVCASLLLLSACVGRSPEALLRDREAHEPSRLLAVAQVSNADLLWRTMANARDTLSVRQAAASRLWSLDGDAFWKRVEREHAQINHGPLWKWLCAEAGKVKEKRALRAMVLSFGKLRLDVNDQSDYPESFPILAITNIWEHPFYLMSIIDGRTAAGDTLQQRAAWIAIARFAKGKSSQLKDSAWSCQQIGDLKNLCLASRILDLLPVCDEELDQINTPKNIQILDGLLTGSPWPNGFSSRHLPLARLTTPPGEHPFQKIQGIERTKDAPLLNATTPDACDLLVCGEIQHALRDDSLVASLFAEADADLSDKRSEHGGLLYWNDKNEVVFEAVPATFRRHDEIYLPPESLFEKLRDGLAHVHFHAQKQNNGEYAGPGKGDLEFVERNRVNAVVFTFVDKDTLNADAYFPGKVVVDLGCIKRPK